MKGNTKETKMKITTPKLIRWAGLSAMVAGIIFAGIQPIHPPDILSSVNTSAFIIITSLNSSFSRCCLIFHDFFLNFQNRTCTEPLLHHEVHKFPFPTSPYSPKTDSEPGSYSHLIPALKSILKIFRMCSVHYFCHISLYGSSN